MKNSKLCGTQYHLNDQEYNELLNLSLYTSKFRTIDKRKNETTQKISTTDYFKSDKIWIASRINSKQVRINETASYLCIYGGAISSLSQSESAAKLQRWC